MRPDPLAILERVVAEPRVAYIAQVFDTYGKAPGGLLANGLAFTALFAAIPTALVTLGLAGWLVNDPAVQAALAEALSATFPPLADVIDAALAALTEGAAVTSIIGVVGLVWSVSQLYVAVDVAFARIFSQAVERDVVRRTARGFLWVAIVIALVVAVIIAATLLTAATTLVPDASPVPGIAADLLTSWPVLLLLGVLTVGAIYRFVPPLTPAWSSLIVPSVLTGIAIGLLTQLFTFLAPRLVGVASIVGSLATIFIALAWLSFSFQALLLGASWVAVADRRRRAEAGSALAASAASAEPGGGGQ